jgi:hypothetical protein
MVLRMKPILPLLALALALPAPAQDSQPTTTGSSTAATPKKAVQLTSPALVVKTANNEVALEMLTRFGSQGLLPELEKGKHYLLQVFGPEKVKISTGDGDVGFLEAMATPGPLARVFEEELAEELSAVEANVTFTFGQFGVPTKEITKMIKAVATFPEQIARVDLKVEGNPMKTAKGVKVDLRLTPAGNTWLGNVVAALEPNDQGAPVLDVKGAPMRLNVAVKPRGLVALAEPMLGFMACFGTRNKDERQGNREMLIKILEGYDGSMAIAGDPFASSVRAISGLRNAAGVKEVMASEAFAKATENRASIVPSVDAEFEQKAFTHRDVIVSRLTMDMSAGGLNQVNTQYSAVAGSYLLAYSGEDKNLAKAMIDAVLDQKVKRAPLVKSALLTLTLDIEKMFDHLAGLGIPAPTEEGGPKLAEIRLFRGENSLQLQVGIE